MIMDTEVISMQPTTDFLSADELVNLRKPEEQTLQLSNGPKFSECNKTEAEEEAVNCAHDNLRTMLVQKRAARICDLMQAEWNEELNVPIVEKLKGKFVQHMGHRIEDKIALNPLESLFLLENGCLEIKKGEAPMSTEEAMTIMLKHNWSRERYIVFSYLSLLGFIVVPHNKEPKNKSQSKVPAAEKNKKKRKVQSPLPEDNRNKRLTFSGAFSEDPITNNDSKVSEESKSLLNDVAMISRGAVSPTKETECPKEINKSVAETGNEVQSNGPEVVSPSPINELENSKTDADHLQSNCSENIPSSPHYNLENSKADVDVEIELDINESSPVKLSSSASAADIDVDSQGTDVLMASLEKSAGVFVAVTKDGTNIDATSQSSDSQLAVINDASDGDERDSVLSVSSCDYDDESGDENSRVIMDDDDITLVEVTKKETTPLAVIDLLSDEEDGPMQTEEPELQEESDDDIKILEVCNGSTSSNKNAQTPLNLNKIKSQKIENCKREESVFRANQNIAPRIQFPELFRKDLVCVARPSLNLLPLHVQPAKEVYILDCAKLQSNRGGNHSGAAPQARVWNSFRDMQDYQRSLRRDRFNRHQNQDRPWQRPPRHFGDAPRRRPSPYHRNNRSSSRDRKSDVSQPDRNSPHSRHGDTDYRDHSMSQYGDGDFNSQNGSEDQKPFRSSHSPAILGDNSRSNPLDSAMPRFPNFNSFPARLPPPNFPSGNSSLNPLDMGNPSRGMSGLTSQEFVAQVQRTAYSYATTMLSSMFGSAFNTNNFSPLAPFPNMRHGSPFGMPQPITLIDGQNNTNLSSPFVNEYYPLPSSRNLHHAELPRHRRYHRTQPFPCDYRNIENKNSWNDVKAAVGGEKEQSESESSDIEEIPINANEFLWNASNICPLIKPGIKHPLADVLNPLKLTQIAKLTDKTCRNEKYFSDNQTLEIAFDVYKPGTPFKKSCPGIPNLRIIVVKASDPVPRYSEIAFLQRRWSDGVPLQIALVDNSDVSFCSFSSICIPHIVPFQE